MAPPLELRGRSSLGGFHRSGLGVFDPGVSNVLGNYFVFDDVGTFDFNQFHGNPTGTITHQVRTKIARIELFVFTARDDGDGTRTLTLGDTMGGTSYEKSLMGPIPDSYGSLTGSHSIVHRDTLPTVTVATDPTMIYGNTPTRNSILTGLTSGATIDADGFRAPNQFLSLGFRPNCGGFYHKSNGVPNVGAFQPNRYLTTYSPTPVPYGFLGGWDGSGFWRQHPSDNATYARRFTWWRQEPLPPYKYEIAFGRISIYHGVEPGKLPNDYYDTAVPTTVTHSFGFVHGEQVSISNRGFLA